MPVADEWATLLENLQCYPCVILERRLVGVGKDDLTLALKPVGATHEQVTDAVRLGADSRKGLLVGKSCIDGTPRANRDVVAASEPVDRIHDSGTSDAEATEKERASPTFRTWSQVRYQLGDVFETVGPPLLTLGELRRDQAKVSESELVEKWRARSHGIQPVIASVCALANTVQKDQIGISRRLRNQCASINDEWHRVGC